MREQERWEDERNRDAQVARAGKVIPNSESLCLEPLSEQAPGKSRAELQATGRQVSVQSKPNVT